jgi:hypothetical protein
LSAEPVLPSREPATGPRARWLPALVRWIHIYASLAGLFAILFFSITGLTLNHPDWTFGQSRSKSEGRGSVDASWVDPALAEDKIDRLRLVEHFRATAGARGLLEDFRVDDAELTLSFQGPASAMEFVIDRKTGSFRFSGQSEGWVAWINDLHKGRHTGRGWAWLIDVSAVLLVLVSVSGLVLLLYLRRRRFAGLLTTAAGVLAFWLLVRWLLP